MTTIKEIYCPYRFSLPNANQQYCIGPKCHAFENVNQGPVYVESRHPYCHALKRFLEANPPQVAGETD